mgnify:CR=1 FL=1
MPPPEAFTVVFEEMVLPVTVNEPKIERMPPPGPEALLLVIWQLVTVSEPVGKAGVVVSAVGLNSAARLVVAFGCCGRVPPRIVSPCKTTLTELAKAEKLLMSKTRSIAPASMIVAPAPGSGDGQVVEKDIEVTGNHLQRHRN